VAAHNQGHSPAAEEDGVDDVMIDLGVLPAATTPAQGAARRRPRSTRPTLLAFAVLAVLLLAGPVHLAAPPGPTVIPARLGDALYYVRDRLYVVSNAGGPVAGLAGRRQEKVISTYVLPAAKLLSRVQVSVTGAITRVEAVADVVLVSQQVDTVGAETTVAFATDTGRPRWQRASRLVATAPSGRLALLVDNGAATGPGPINWFGVDAATGATRWSQAEPVNGTTEAVWGPGEFPSRLVTATTAGRVEVYDPQSGRVTATATVPAPAEWRRRGLNIWLVGDLVLLGGRGGITAYGLNDLRARWHSPVDLTEVFVLPVCGEAICLFGRFGGVQMIDPATGRQRWGDAQWAAVQQVGAFLLANGDESPPGPAKQAVLDPATGRRVGALGPWQPVGDPSPAGTIVGLREQLSDRRVWFAELDPGRLSVRVLGSAEPVSGECNALLGVLVCRRIDASIGIWQLAAGRL
jgi:hypothetical protein